MEGKWLSKKSANAMIALIISYHRYCIFNHEYFSCILADEKERSSLLVREVPALPYRTKHPTSDFHLDFAAEGDQSIGSDSIHIFQIKNKNLDVLKNYFNINLND